MRVPQHVLREVWALYGVFCDENTEGTSYERQVRFKAVLKARYRWASRKDLETWYDVVRDKEERTARTRSAREYLRANADVLRGLARGGHVEDDALAHEARRLVGDGLATFDVDRIAARLAVDSERFSELKTVTERMRARRARAPLPRRAALLQVPVDVTVRPCLALIRPPQFRDDIIYNKTLQLHPMQP